jgi:hypothetical protein
MRKISRKGRTTQYMRLLILPAGGALLRLLLRDRSKHELGWKQVSTVSTSDLTSCHSHSHIRLQEYSSTLYITAVGRLKQSDIEAAEKLNEHLVQLHNSYGLIRLLPFPESLEIRSWTVSIL